ncbi:unnamed protein product [Urochloa humidicola]
MVTQTQILRQMTDALVLQQETPKEKRWKRIKSFLKLKPPTFDQATKPLDAEDWLEEIEKRLELSACTKEECVEAATYQLIGTARAWWNAYYQSHENPSRICWKEFTEAFLKFHIPKQIWVNKLEKFLKMTQGTMTVLEYARYFTKMMRYAPDQTNTDEKKQFWFHKGLNPEIRIILAGAEYPSLNHMVNRALAVEEEQIGRDGSLRAKKRRDEYQSLPVTHPSSSICRR